MFWTPDKKHSDPYAFERIGSVPNVIVAAWSAYEAFRRYGFRGEAIQTIQSPGVILKTATKEDYIHVVLSARDKSFAITVGPVSGGDDIEAHRRLIEGISGGKVTEPELVRAWLWSPVVNPFERFVTIGIGLVDKGILSVSELETVAYSATTSMSKGGQA